MARSKSVNSRSLKDFKFLGLINKIERVMHKLARSVDGVTVTKLSRWGWNPAWSRRNLEKLVQRGIYVKSETYLGSCSLGPRYHMNEDGRRLRIDDAMEKGNFRVEWCMDNIGTPQRQTIPSSDLAINRRLFEPPIITPGSYNFPRKQNTNESS